MDRKLTFVSAAAFVLVLGGAARAADFQLGFEGCPTGVVTGETVGELKTFDIFATLTTSNNTEADGPQGWSISMSVTGGTVKAWTHKGVHVSTIFDEDGDDGDGDGKIDTGFPGEGGPATPVVDPFDLDLKDAGFKVSQLASLPADPARKGTVSAIVLHQTQRMVLHPTGTVQLAKMTLEVPVAATPTDVVVKFENGFKGQGQPVNNVVTFKGASVTPNLGECRFQVRQASGPEPEFNLAVAPAGGGAALPVEGGFAVLTRSLPPGQQDIACVMTLSTKNLPAGGVGPQGWSISVQNELCTTVQAVTHKGVHVSTIFDEDGDDGNGDGKIDTGFPGEGGPATPVVDPFDLDLKDAGFKVSQLASGADPSPLPDDAKGVVSAIVLHQTQRMILHPNTTDTILSVTYRVNVVAGVNPDCKISFVDGLKGQGQPVNNVITYLGESKTPTNRQGLILRLTGQTAEEPDNFVRGDANNDGSGNTGRVDIADAVYIVYNVIPALAATGNYAIPCKDAGDANADGLLNLADAVYIIDWQFRGPKPPPSAPYPTCGKTGSTTAVTCPPATACGAPGR